MILAESSLARVGNNIVRAISSSTTNLREFFVFTDIVLSSIISGNVSLVKNGTGILTLSNTSNSYSGNASVNTGVLVITDIAALPGWNVNGRYSVQSGATLAVYNAVTDANITTILGTTNFNAGSAIGFDTTSGNRTYPNVIANTAKGALGLTKLGVNTLTISGANSYTGPTLVIAGTLATSTANRIPDASAVTILSGAIITLGGSDTFATLAGAGTLTCGANALTLNSTNSATFSGTLTNTAGTFFKSGTGTQTLSGSTTVSGQTRLDAGGIVSSGTFTQTAVAGARNFQIALAGGTTAALTVSGGTMTVTGLFFGENNGGSATVNVNAGTLRVNGETWMAGLASTLNVNGGTFSGSSYDIGGGSGTTTSIVNIISGTFALTGNLRWGIAGAGATSVINLDGGTFRCHNWFRNGGTNTFNFNGGTFIATSTLTLPTPLSYIVKSGGAIFSPNSGITLTTAGLSDGGGSGGLVKLGSGTLVLNGAMSYTGVTTISYGTLQLTSSTGLMASSGITNNSDLTLNINANTSQSAIFPSVSGSGSLTTITGIITLNLNNSYTGQTRINGGVLNLGHENGFGSGEIRFSGTGVLGWASGVTTDISNRIRNNTSAVRFQFPALTRTISSLDSTNTGGLVKTGLGRLVLAGSGNTFTGAITISAGEATFSGTYTATNDVKINGSANPILNISGNFTQTFTGSSVRSFQLAANSGNTGTVNVSGSAVVTLNGGMMLGDNSGGNGTFNQTGGTVSTSTSGTWLAGAVCLLNVSGGTFTTPGIECGGGTGAGTITVSGTGTINSGSLILNRGSGAGVSAVLNVNGGTLKATGITHITTARPATINFNGGTFSSLNTMSMPSTVTCVIKSGGAILDTFAGQLNVQTVLTTDGTGGGLIKQGSGTLALGSVAHTYTGSTTISAGAITVSKTTNTITGAATYTPTSLTVNFSNVTPNSGDTYRFFPGSTATTGLTISLINAGGKTGSYDYANSTLTIN